MIENDGYSRMTNPMIENCDYQWLDGQHQWLGWCNVLMVNPIIVWKNMQML